MKAIIEESSLSLKEKINWMIGKKNKEEVTFEGKTILYYRIPPLNNPAGLIRELKKQKVEELVIKKVKNEKTVNALFNEFSILNCKRIMINRLEEILIKIIKMLGIPHGKLSLGLMVSKEDLSLIFSLRSIREQIKYIYLYCENTDEAEKAADRFYNETGVGVIVRSEMKAEQVDFLIYKKGNQKKFPLDLQMILNLSEEKRDFGNRTIEDVKLKLPPFLEKFPLRDLEREGLFSKHYPIKGFVMSEREGKVKKGLT